MWRTCAHVQQMLAICKMMRRNDKQLSSYLRLRISNERYNLFQRVHLNEKPALDYE
jgi:hypothetical protein